MALEAGSISVDEFGNVTGSGLALELFNGGLDAIEEDERAAVAATMAPFCEGMATAIVDHIKNNAEVTITITTSDGALQRTPDPNDPNSDTQAPSTEKTLTGTIA